MSQVRADRPTTLDGVLACSESIMPHESKVILIAMVKRQRRAGPGNALPIGIPELFAKLGMDPAVGHDALRMLIRLDYVHREGDRVLMVLNHPVLSMLELGPVAKMEPDEIRAWLEKRKPNTAKRARLVANATGKKMPKPAPVDEPRNAVEVAPPLSDAPVKASKKKSKKKSKSKKITG